MSELKTYWIRSDLSTVRFIKNIDEPLTEHNGGDVNPAWLRENFRGVCLLSKMEQGKNCLVKVWFFYSELAKRFRNPEFREEYSYWVEPGWLVEINL
jgi:hypothetical protein